MNHEQWVLHFRNFCTGQYAERTFGTALKEELRLVAEGCTNRDFSRLFLVRDTSDEKLYRHRYFGFEPPILAAMVYDHAERSQTHLVPIRDLSEQADCVSRLRLRRRTKRIPPQTGSAA